MMTSQKDNINNYLFSIYRSCTKLMFRRGSQVYGTANKDSDTDFICVVDDNCDDFAKYTDGIYEYKSETNNVDYQFLTESRFIEMIEKHHIVALEGLFLDKKNIVFGDMEKYRKMFALDKWKLRETISSICNNSWAKAHKKMTVEKDIDIYRAKKSLFHVLRLFDIGKQIAENGRIVDYSSCNDLWFKIFNDESTEWEHYKKEYAKLRNQMRSAMVKVCPRPEETEKDFGLDEQVKKKFSELHKELVDKVVSFCKENNIPFVENCHLDADGLDISIPHGYWTPGSDSAMGLYDKDNNTVLYSI